MEVIMSSPFKGRIEPGLLFIAEAAYVYYLVLRLPKGLPRLLALLPLVPISHVVIMRAPTAIERVICGVLFMWLILFKLLLLAWDKGLAADSLSSFPRFLYAFQSPTHLQQDPQFSHPKHEVGSRKGNSESEESAAAEKKSSQADGLLVEDVAKGETTTKFSSWVWMMATSQALPVLIVRSLLFYIITTSIIRIIQVWKDDVSDYVIDLLTGLLIYFFMSLLFDGAVMIPACIAGTKVQPFMDMPFLSTSLGEFWGQRWNMVIINLGRVSVYEPMLNFLKQGKKKPSLLDRAIATEAVFLVSGLMHELATFYSTLTRPSWEMTTFFLVNGLGTLGERFIVKSKYSFQVPKFLRWAITWTFIYFTGHWFFCSPVRTNLLESVGDAPGDPYGFWSMGSKR